MSSYTVTSGKAQRELVLFSCSLKSPKHLEVCKSNLGKSLTNVLQLFFREYLKSMGLVTQKDNAQNVHIKIYISTKNILFEVRPSFLILTSWQVFWLSDFFFLCFAHLKTRNKLENICQISCLLISSMSDASGGREKKHPQE